MYLSVTFINLVLIFQTNTSLMTIHKLIWFWDQDNIANVMLRIRSVYYSLILSVCTDKMLHIKSLSATAWWSIAFSAWSDGHIKWCFMLTLFGSTSELSAWSSSVFPFAVLLKDPKILFFFMPALCRRHLRSSPQDWITK